YLRPLCEEIDAGIQNHGLPKGAIVPMCKVDSFLAETRRLRVVFTGTYVIDRCSLQSSDGTIILKGTHLSVPTHTVRRDGAVYGNPGVFNPFQLSQLNDDDCEGAGHRTVATTGLLSLRIWEGCMIQFRSSRTLLATNELKIILAHILMSYDVRFGDRVSWPTSIHWDLNLIANPVVRIMSRNRANN
ncbi:hypothetical protein EDD17DRAFT_1489881, partial [Pisolithus thermaeus]